MGKAVHLQSSFSSGELSPYMRGRTTLAQYTNGCQELQNMVVLPQGGVTKRPGTEFIREVKDSSKNTVLIPFVIGSDQSYILEFGDLYLRFYRNGGILLSTAAITNGTFTTNLDGWTDGDTGTGVSSQTAGVMRLNGGAGGVAIRTQGVEYVGVGTYVLTFTSATNACDYRIGSTSGGTEWKSGTSTLGVNAVSFTTTSAGTVYVQFRNAANNDADVDTVSLSTGVYELNTPWSASDVSELQYAASKDTMYIVHPDHAIRKLRRFGASQWDIVTVDLVDGPYYSKTHSKYGGVGTGFTMGLSGTTGSVTVTTSGDVFVSTDVGRAIRYRPNTSAEWGELTITAYTDSKHVTATVEKVQAATTASTEWKLGAFSGTTGYPSCVAFHEQRLVLANTDSQSQTLWFSRAGDIEVFQPDNDSYKDEVDSTSAMTYTVASKDSNDIVWLSSRNALLIGTTGVIFAAKASSLDEAITPTNISIKPAVKNASYRSMPIETTSATLFIHNHQRKVMELAYSVEQDSMVSVDLSILAEHLGQNKFQQIVRQEEPYNILWAITETGDLAGLTYLRDQQVVGWHRHVLGGTDVSVKSIATIPGTRESELWLIVSRTINGDTKQYVERLTSFFRDDIDAVDAFFLDCGDTYSGVPATTISGLSHLEGETVSAYADGYVGVVSDVVTSGEITLQQAASKVHVGLPYTAVLRNMPLELQGSVGSVQGSIIRAWKSFLRFHRSALAKVGYSTTDSDIVENFGDDYVMGGAIPLFTGIKEIPYNHGPELELWTYVEQTQPAPLTVLVLGTKLIIDDDR